MPPIGDNLSDKFQAILDALTGMSAVQTDLLTAQNVTNSKLDDLIAAINNQTTALQTGQLDQADVTAAIDASGLLGNVFSGIQGLGGGTDLAALLAAIGALRGADQRTLTDLFNKPTAELVGDVTIDVTGVEQRLDQVYAALIGTSGDPTDIRAAIWNLAGPAPGASLADLLTAIQAGNAEWDSGAGITAYNLLDALRSEAVTRNNLLSAIDAEWDSGAGITPYNLLDSIRSNAIAMVQCCEAQSGGVTPPLSGDEGACAGSEYVSSGMEEITDQSSNETGIVATWSTVPDHVQLFDGRKLSPGSTGWDGYSVWVQSTATSFRLNLVDSNRYPTNQWVDLSSFGSTLLLFAVDVSHSLSVTLCGPTTISDCVDAEAQLLQSSRWGASYYIIVWPEVPGFTRQVRLATDASDTYAGYVSLWGGFTGWKINAFEGTTPISPQYLLQGITRNTTTGELSGNGAISVNYSSNANNQQPFRVELCPV
jgi:hypothetical protein